MKTRPLGVDTDCCSGGGCDAVYGVLVSVFGSVKTGLCVSEKLQGSWFSNGYCGKVSVMGMSIFIQVAGDAAEKSESTSASVHSSCGNHRASACSSCETNRTEDDWTLQSWMFINAACQAVKQ